MKFVRILELESGEHNCIGKVSRFISNYNTIMNNISKSNLDHRTMRLVLQGYKQHMKQHVVQGKIQLPKEVQSWLCSYIVYFYTTKLDKIEKAL